MQKTGFLIGRFQPLHMGHRQLIRQALSQCDRLIIIVGSANSARTIKNPFTYEERKAELEAFLASEIIDSLRAVIVPINDYKYSNSQWMSDVSMILDTYSIPGSKIVMFGHEKPGNDYLNWFKPQIDSQCFDTLYDVSGTEMRKMWFEQMPGKFDPSVIDDFKYFEKEKVIFGNYPFPETLNFCCGDAIVECVGHILLVQRANTPGRGTWALPGGFKNNDETYTDTAIRELLEEINIRVPEKVLRGSIVETRLFDAPDRGMGIPRNTLAVHIQIKPEPDGSLPRVSPKSETLKARFFPIYDIMNTMQLFDDHSHIISTMCKVLPIPAHLNPIYVG